MVNLSTPKSFLLDTNIVIAIQNEDRSITKRMIPEAKVYLPAVAVGELLSGAHRSDRVHENLEAVKTICRDFPILPCNAGTAAAYGTLHAHLLNKGRPIPENDIWIAAIAHQRGLTLITRDAHFSYIDFLSILVW